MSKVRVSSHFKDLQEDIEKSGKVWLNLGNKLYFCDLQNFLVQFCVNMTLEDQEET